MTTFRKVEQLSFDKWGTQARVVFDENQDYIALECRTLVPEQAIALCDWLASATGHYPKEQKP